MKNHLNNVLPRPRGARLLSPELQHRSGQFYHVAEDGGSITCCVCGATSRDPKDIREKYCPQCRVFHEDRMVMVRVTEGYQTRFNWEAQAHSRWKTAA